MVREFGDALQRVVDGWLLDYRACAERAISKRKLSADARESASRFSSPSSHSSS